MDFEGADRGSKDDQQGCLAEKKTARDPRPTEHPPKRGDAVGLRGEAAPREPWALSLDGRELPHALRGSPAGHTWGRG